MHTVNFYFVDFVAAFILHLLLYIGQIRVEFNVAVVLCREFVLTKF